LVSVSLIHLLQLNLPLTVLFVAFCELPSFSVPVLMPSKRKRSDTKSRNFLLFLFVDVFDYLSFLLIQLTRRYDQQTQSGEQQRSQDTINPND